jgi:hypothetical protein
MSKPIIYCIVLYCNICFTAYAAGIQGEWITYGTRLTEYTMTIDEERQTITMPARWVSYPLHPSSESFADEQKKTLETVPYALYDEDPLRLGRVPEDAPPVRLGRMHEDVLLLRTRYKKDNFENYSPIILLRKGVHFKIPKTKPRGRWFFSKPGTESKPVVDIVLDLDKATETAYSLDEIPPRSLGANQFRKRSKTLSPYVLAFGSGSIEFNFFWLCEGLLLLDIRSKFPFPETLLLRPYVGNSMLSEKKDGYGFYP